MKLVPCFFILILAAVLSSCGSSHDAGQNSSAEHHHQTASKPPTPPATAITENVSGVEAVVEDVQDFGGTEFNLRIFVVSTSTTGGRTSVVEAGQKLIVSPHYFADSTGKVNFEEPRNKRILSLKTKTSGESFKGKLSINRNGGWNVVDVEESK